MTPENKSIYCHQCKTNECLQMYPRGVPEYCQAKKYSEVIETSKQQYFDPEIASIHLATARVLKNGGYDWTRVQQCIEFARELGATRVGLAVCMGVIREGNEFARLLNRAGLEVVSVACMIGGVNARETGVPDELLTLNGISCNPIAQAEIMNREGTQLNYIYGLCVGHDTIFIKKSQAPVTYVVAKDTVTGNNPGAVLFSTFHRIKFAERYGRD